MESAIKLRGFVKRFGPITAVDGLDLTVPEGKVAVCKYVGTPGEDEVLQTGQNPIWDGVNSAARS